MATKERSGRKRTRQRARARLQEQMRTLKAQARFLKQFAASGNVRLSAAAAGISRTTAYEWRTTHERFRELWDVALQDAYDALEEEARRRAIDGVLEPVFQGGEKVGTIRKYSDTLLITLLKARRPEHFRERYELTGKDGGPIQTEVFDQAKTSLLRKLQQLSARAAATIAKSGSPAAQGRS